MRDVIYGWPFNAIKNVTYGNIIVKIDFQLHSTSQRHTMTLQEGRHKNDVKNDFSFLFPALELRHLWQVICSAAFAERARGHSQ